MDEAAWLCTADGASAVDLAEAVVAEHPSDPLTASTVLRRRLPDLSAPRASAALEQAELRRSAAQRHGLAAEALLLTRDGLEQATRPAVAALRAEAFVAAGAQRVLDLTGGLGLDDRAFVSAGLEVIALERDPNTAMLLRHNVPSATVVCADATDPGVLAPLLAQLGPADVVFVDPARRAQGGPRDLSSGRARPERDPERWSPPWSFVAAVPHPRVATKTAPGFTPPVGWRAQWTSVDRVVVECAVFSWGLFEPARRALVLGNRDAMTVDAVDDQLPVAATLDRWLLEPDPALISATATPALRKVQPDLAQGDPQSTWLACDDDPVPSLAGLVRAYRVREVLTGNAKQQRRRLRDLGIDRLVVKSRDVRRDPQQVLRELGCHEGGPATLIMTLRAGKAISVLVDPVPLPAT